MNILAPGTVATDVWKVLPDGEGRVAEAIRRALTGNLATAEEVALTAQFLCSEGAAGIIGHTLVVDRGERILG